MSEVTVRPPIAPGSYPYGWLFFAVWVAVVLLQIVALAIAFVRRRRARAGAGPSLKLQVAAGVALLVLFAVGAAAVHAARNISMEAFALRRAPWDAGFGIVAQVNAFPAVTGRCLIAALLWIPGLWLTMDARCRAGVGRRLPLAAIAWLGLLPAIAGVWRWSATLADAFRASVNVPFAEHHAILEQGAALARARLEPFARAASWAIVALAAVAVVAIVVGHARRSTPAPPPPAGSPRVALLASGIALALAGVLFLAAWPMRAENRLPWPPAQRDDYRWFDTTTPALVGPDAITGGPLVHLWPIAGDPAGAVIELDNREVAADSLVDRLWQMRQEFAQRHPGEEFDGVVVAVVNRAAPYRAVVSMLRAAHDAGYAHPLFAFTRYESADRPLFGPLRRPRASAARATLIDAADVMFADGPLGGETGTLVRLADFASYDALAGRLIELRRVGEPVVLDLAHLR
jgi:hypothetical protein